MSAEDKPSTPTSPASSGGPKLKFLDQLLPHRSRSVHSQHSQESLTSPATGGWTPARPPRDRAADRREFDRQLLMRRRMSAQHAEETETEEERARYGHWDLYHTEIDDYQHIQELEEINRAADKDPAVLDKHIGETWSFRVRIHTIRPLSQHLSFVVLRERGHTLQAVLKDDKTGNSQHMMRWVMRLPVETLVFVRGVLQRPHETITGCDVTHVELGLTHVHVVATVSEPPAFNVYAAERSSSHRLEENKELDDGESDGESSSALHRSTASVNSDTASQKSSGHGSQPIITQRTRLNNRLIDLRTPTMQATFRMQSVICREFRAFLSEQGFTEVHTPKLQGGASESGASVFRVEYFGRSAFLAQSPQLYKQMCIAADMRRVFEIGPVFRAENSNTARHLTEYTGLDLEMEVNHYYDALTVIDGMLKRIFTVLRDECANSIQAVRRHYPSTDFQWLDQTLVLSFPEGIRLLKEAGYREEDGSEPSEDDDMHTRGEIKLGEIVKEKFGTDYYVLDKFPSSARPFYTLADPNDARRTNSFDIFVRGQEICTGGQRIHRADVLEENIKRLGMDTNGLEEYLEGFRLGAPPHAGCGIGLERLLMLYLNMDDIRLTSLFYRDPKSFPNRPANELRHPEASTNPPPWLSSSASEERAPESPEGFQPLEQLIANYGDSTNTSWLDDRMSVWRDAETGAAVGYAKGKRAVLAMGNPLCDLSQYETTMSRFIEFCHSELHAKPIWMMVSERVESILGGRHGWCTLTCTADQRIHDLRRNTAKNEHEMQRKIRHAGKTGVSIDEYGFHQTVPDDVRQQCDKRIRDWQRSRHGMQVHLTEVHPWQDQEHRSYFVARDSDKQVCCLVVLAQLAPVNGYQVKWAISFPNAPNGAIEMTIFTAFDTVGSGPVTFGTAAASRVEAVHGLSNIGFKLLSRIYNGVADKASLGSKSDFREKLGCVRDPTYICYPKGSMNLLTVREIIDFFKD